MDYRDAKIHVINFKGEYDPFTIGDFEQGDVYAGELTDYSVFPSWNHWPVAQMPSDGRYAKHPDRTAHSSLTHVVPAVYRNQEGKRPYQERLLLEGMSKQTPAELATLARSWLHAPISRRSRVHCGDHTTRPSANTRCVPPTGPCRLPSRRRKSTRS